MNEKKHTGDSGFQKILLMLKIIGCFIIGILGYFYNITLLMAIAAIFFISIIIIALVPEVPSSGKNRFKAASLFWAVILTITVLFVALGI